MPEYTVFTVFDKTWMGLRNATLFMLLGSSLRHLALSLRTPLRPVEKEKLLWSVREEASKEKEDLELLTPGLESLMLLGHPQI